jgi:Kef-type K+ transport system membrane component KefB
MRSSGLSTLLAVTLVAAFVPAVASAGTGAVSSDRVASVALGVGVVLIAAKVGGEVAVRLGQVAVLGELLAGVALGNLPGLGRLGWIDADPSIDLLAQLGTLVLLFDVGLELTVREMLATRAAAAGIALLGTACSFGLGWLVALLLHPGAPPAVSVFFGAALTATSVGITARVLKDLGQTKAPEAVAIVGAAVLDDVVGLILLAVVTGSIAAAGVQRASPVALAGWILVKAGAFFAGALVVGRKVIPALFAASARLRTTGAQVSVGFASCLLFAWAADAVGLAPIIGAFTAGLILEEAHSERFVARGERSLAELVQPVSSVLVPIFFVLMGARVDVRALADSRAAALAAALTLAAILGKAACSLGARGLRRGPVAAGMIPRGEVTLIYASLGLTLQAGGRPLLDRGGFSALVLVVVATTLATPPALAWAFRRPGGGGGTDQRSVAAPHGPSMSA